MKPRKVKMTPGRLVVSRLVLGSRMSPLVINLGAMSCSIDGAFEVAVLDLLEGQQVVFPVVLLRRLSQLGRSDRNGHDPGSWWQNRRGDGGGY
jgi:hypothetical protein